MRTRIVLSALLVLGTCTVASASSPAPYSVAPPPHAAPPRRAPPPIVVPITIPIGGQHHGRKPRVAVYPEPPRYGTYRSKRYGKHQRSVRRGVYEPQPYKEPRRIQIGGPKCSDGDRFDDKLGLCVAGTITRIDMPPEHKAYLRGCPGVIKTQVILRGNVYVEQQRCVRDEIDKVGLIETDEPPEYIEKDDLPPREKVTK